jgi:hypothetical protein
MEVLRKLISTKSSYFATGMMENQAFQITKRELFQMSYELLSHDILQYINALMPRHRGVLNISQLYRPPLPVIGIALFFLIFTDELRAIQQTSFEH